VRIRLVATILFRPSCFNPLYFRGKKPQQSLLITGDSHIGT